MSEEPQENAPPIQWEQGKTMSNEQDKTTPIMPLSAQCFIHADELKRMGVCMDDLRRDVHDIKAALEGTKLNRHGVLPTIDDHEERLAALESDKAMAKGVIAAMTAVGAVIGSVLTMLGKHFLTKGP